MDNAAECPECGTRGYLIFPSYGNCQICLRLRLEFIERVYSPPSASEVRS